MLALLDNLFQGIRHTVIRRVFDGGEGVTSGGRADRSREIGVCVPFDIEVDVGLPEEEAGEDLDLS